MISDRYGRYMAYGAGLALFAWFIFAIRGGLDSWFDGDDIMNLHYYWSRPWSALLKANLFFWSSYLRPMGGVFYRAIYESWGFDPLPFRIAALALLSVNFALLAAVVWQLTGSRWGALAALLLVGINPSFAGVYFDTGAIYDVLAYTFFWGGFAWYVRLRRGGRLPGWGSLALVFCAFVAALNAKEIAVSLPAAVGLYELIWHPPANWKPAELWRWIRQEGRFAAVGGLAGIGYMAGKRYGADSLWQLDAYRPHFSLAAYFAALAHYLSGLIFKPVTILSWQIAVLMAAMLLLGAATRRRCLLWGAGFIAVGVLPLAFIPPRDGVAYLVPSVGWAVYGAGFLDWLLGILTGRSLRFRHAARAGVLILLFAVLAPWQRKWIEMRAAEAHQMQAALRDRFMRYQGQILALIPAPRKGAQILLLSDADGRDDWGIYMLIRLTYGDPSLQAYRKTVWDAHHMPIDASGFDYVLDWVNGRFVLVSRK
ncbi:MAG: hypothetical protein ABSC93_09735 [Bryobacteraceae bacterium]